MPSKKISAIKKWIEAMGFELVNSHLISGKYNRINYYSLGNFGIYEEIAKPAKSQTESEGKRKFISWNPWGDDFEVNSVRELSEAYQDSLIINPELAL